MVIECIGICCTNNDFFLNKKRPNFNKESICDICDKVINKPTFKEILIKIGCETDPNEHYYDIKGLLTETLTISPLKMQFPEDVECICCHAEARGKKLPQAKEYFQVGDKGNKVSLGYIKEELPNYREKSYKELEKELGKRGLRPIPNIYDYRRELGFDKVKPAYSKAEIQESVELGKALKDSVFDPSFEPRLDNIVNRRLAKDEGKEDSDIT
jgi:hypothetical protein